MIDITAMFYARFHAHAPASQIPRRQRQKFDPRWHAPAQYEFHIVIENAIVDDYVTEKFYEGLKAGSLMVYLGAPNAAEYGPAPKSFLDASAFEGPEQLAEYLEFLRGNSTEYASYFGWRHDGPSLAFKRRVRSPPRAAHHHPDLRFAPDGERGIRGQPCARPHLLLAV